METPEQQNVANDNMIDESLLKNRLAEQSRKHQRELNELQEQHQTAMDALSSKLDDLTSSLSPLLSKAASNIVGEPVQPAQAATPAPAPAPAPASAPAPEQAAPAPMIQMTPEQLEQHNQSIINNHAVQQQNDAQMQQQNQAEQAQQQAMMDTLQKLHDASQNDDELNQLLSDPQKGGAIPQSALADLAGQTDPVGSLKMLASDPDLIKQYNEGNAIAKRQILNGIQEQLVAASLKKQLPSNVPSIGKSGASAINKNPSDMSPREYRAYQRSRGMY